MHYKTIKKLKVANGNEVLLARNNGGENRKAEAEFKNKQKNFLNLLECCNTTTLAWSPNGRIIAKKNVGTLPVISSTYIGPCATGQSTSLPKLLEVDIYETDLYSSLGTMATLASTSMTLLFFFFSLNSIFTSTNQSNALDPLTPSELNEVRTIIKGFNLSPFHNLTVHYVCLD